MNLYSGCWVEFRGRENWAICWPDATVLESGLLNRKAAERALLYYRCEWEEANRSKAMVFSGLAPAFAELRRFNDYEGARGNLVAILREIADDIESRRLTESGTPIKLPQADAEDGDVIE